MFFAPNPGILAAGVSTAKTYAEGVAHITALAVDGSRDWDTGTQGNASAAVITTAGTVSAANMTGSSWASRLRGSVTSGLARVVQHGLFSEADFNDQVSNGRVVFVRLLALTAGPTFPSLTRNGYTSNSSGLTNTPLEATEIIYWNGTRWMRMQPSLGLGPTPYDW